MRLKTKKDATIHWVTSFNEVPQSALIKLAEYSNGTDGYEITPYTDEEKDNLYEIFPMWNTMWTFYDIIDDWWLEQNLDVMKECGFRIYEFEDFGYVFGIDGAGYDFYEAHWIPLYEARGMRWHEE